MGRSTVGRVHFARSNGCRRFLGDVMAVSRRAAATPAHALDWSMPERGNDDILCPSGHQTKCLAGAQPFKQIMAEPGDLVYDPFRGWMACDSDGHDPAREHFPPQLADRVDRTRFTFQIVVFRAQG